MSEMERDTGAGICLITAYLLFLEGLCNSSETTTNITDVDLICPHHAGVEAPKTTSVEGGDGRGWGVLFQS